MSQSPRMIDCPQCSHVVLAKDIKVTVSTGMIIRQINNFSVEDVCDKCGGSGRILAYHVKMFDTKTIALKKKQKVIMHEWLAQEKELVYGVKE